MSISTTLHDIIQKSFSVEGVYPNITKSSLDVLLQDLTTKPIIQNFYLKEVVTTLALDTVIDERTIEVASATGIIAGKYIVMFSTVLNKVMFCNVLSVSGTTITIDTPIDSIYESGTIISVGDKNIVANGSVTPVVYSLRSTSEQTLLNFHVTRIILVSKTSSVGDMSMFGDIAGGLTNGIVLRKVDGKNENIFNAKTNGNLMNIMYDFDILSAVNPRQGQNGFKGRMTFAGQNKMGVAVKLAPGEDLELVVQDDLSSLDGFVIIAEGHLSE